MIEMRTIAFRLNVRYNVPFCSNGARCSIGFLLVIHRLIVGEQSRSLYIARGEHKYCTRLFQLFQQPDRLLSRSADV